MEPEIPTQAQLEQNTFNWIGAKRFIQRASEACVHCRTRKHRCDAMNRGLPCTNCRLDGTPCNLAAQPRRKYVDGSSLPRFIKRLPCRLQSQEIKSLRTKGALIVPKPQILWPLIEAYIDHVHPYMPVIDIQQLLITIFQKNAHGRLSLFLLQAILFAGAHFIAENLLVIAGYRDRDTARRIFFQRAKVRPYLITSRRT